MNIRSELASAVVVAKEVAHNCEDDADGLERDVPAGTDNLRKLDGGMKKFYGAGSC